MDAQAELNRLADFGPATTVEPATGQWEIKAHSGEPGPPSDDERDALAAPANRGAPPVTVAEYGKSGERRRDPSGTITRISAPGSADLSLPSLRGRRARWHAQLAACERAGSYSSIGVAGGPRPHHQLAGRSRENAQRAAAKDC